MKTKLEISLKEQSSSSLSEKLDIFKLIEKLPIELFETEVSLVENDYSTYQTVVLQVAHL